MPDAIRDSLITGASLDDTAPSKFRTIDVRGAGQGDGQGTSAWAVSSTGAVTGSWTDSGNFNHGFVATNGQIITFDVPSSDSPPVPATTPDHPFEGTIAWAINSNGAIVGQLQGGNFVFHGFMRATDGTISRYDAPNAGTGAGQGTVLNSINSSGEMAGNYLDANNVFHSFLLSPSGSYTPIDVPGAGKNASQGTTIAGVQDTINDAGAVTGLYITPNNVGHGWVRSADGKITTFDDPNAGTAGNKGEGTGPLAIGPDGSIVGTYVDSSMKSHGFLRSPDGKFTTIDDPNQGTGTTTPVSIDQFGDIFGFYSDSKGINHGFVRPPDGTYIPFDAPGASAGTNIAPGGEGGTFGGTYGVSNGDSNTVLHAYLATIPLS